MKFHLLISTNLVPEGICSCRIKIGPAKLSPSNNGTVLGCQWLDNVDMHIKKQDLIKIYHVVQKGLEFSQTAHGRTDTHSNYSAHLRVKCFNTCYKGTVVDTVFASIYLNNPYRLGLKGGWGVGDVVGEVCIPVIRLVKQISKI